MDFPSSFRAPQITEKREGELLCFTKEHGLSFSDLRFLNLAFTHTSYANESKVHVDDNEKLEFLGDSVLGMITAEYLFSSFKDLHEGEFSKIKAIVVSEDSLSEVAMDIDEETLKKAILADCMEAVIAALYLDQGLDVARQYVLSFIKDQVNLFLSDKVAYKDYKTMLQEFLQKRKKELPLYTVVGHEGPDHAQEFKVEVMVMGKTYGPARGANKKSAEQAAARMALVSLGIARS